MQGLKGEYIVDDRCWIIKAHHPCSIPKCLEYVSNKVICCVRNPLDVFVSWACFTNTMNHSTKPSWEFHTDYPDWWDWWVRVQVQCFKKYFEYVFEHSVEKMEEYNPIYFVRYEDMVKDSEPPTRGVLQYLFELDDISGTNAERRIKQYLEKKKANPGMDRTYVTKQTTGVPNAHKAKYTESQLEHIRTELAHYLHFFGYVNNPDADGEVNDTAFFNFEEPHPEESENYFGFHKSNQIAQDRVTGKDGKDKKVYEYAINSADNCFALFTETEQMRV